ITILITLTLPHRLSFNFPHFPRFFSVISLRSEHNLIPKYIMPFGTHLKLYCVTTWSLVRKRISSAYIIILCSLPPLSTPLMPGFSLMATARGSSAIVNKRGERGQPCRVPLERLKNDEVNPSNSNFHLILSHWFIKNVCLLSR
uniref:Uncharacterized protein n=1 Tax=Sander lucioperca TaxID=283035 RepID=A0A8C9Y9C3_SANLU